MIDKFWGNSVSNWWEGGETEATSVAQIIP